jgi:IS4 transposase
MKGLPRGVFERSVQTHKADKHSKGFRCWDQLLALLYGQLSGVSSLRELEQGFNSQFTHHYHLGTGSIRRSTLAEANAKRKPEVFAEVVRALMSQAKRALRREGERLLYLLDSSPITLKGLGFDDWTSRNRTRRTQGIKLHLLYAQEEAVPVWQSITAPNVNDCTEGLRIELQANVMYVFDKGYCDYNWWHRIDQAKAYFVTRFKSNAGLVVERVQPIAPAAAASILADEIVRFKHKHPSGGRRNHYAQALRRIVVARPDHPRPLVLATNDLESPALAIAQCYKRRWDIELFFKWIKQHLKIKRFLGRSENAVRIQILTALIAYLLLALYRKTHGITKSLWHLLAELRATLFQRPGSEAEQYRRRREQLLELSTRQAVLFA